MEKKGESEKASKFLKRLSTLTHSLTQIYRHTEANKFNKEAINQQLKDINKKQTHTQTQTHAYTHTQCLRISFALTTEMYETVKL